MKTVARTPQSPALVMVRGELSANAAVTVETYRRPVAYALWASGLLFMIGAMLDLVLLWGFQRDAANPAWEFVALSNTIEGMPRIALGIALVASGLYIRGWTMVWLYRGLALMLVLMGIAGAIIGGLVISDYFVLRGNVTPAQAVAFTSVVLKAVALSGLHVVLLIPLGVLSMRRPRS